MQTIFRLLPLFLFFPFAYAKIEFNKGDRILLYGNSFIERLQENGTFEAHIQLANPEKELEFRSLAWTGDEVGNRLRPEGYVNHLKHLLGKWPAHHLILGFGMNESFAGKEGIERFKGDLEVYLREMRRRHPEASLTLLSPIAVEDTGNPLHPDHSARNQDIAAYCKAMEDIAGSNDANFFNLYDFSLEAYGGTYSLTSNGIHLNDQGNRLIGSWLAKEILGELPNAAPGRPVELARAVSRKAKHVADSVRPLNAVLYYGVRRRQNEYNAEIPRFLELVEKAEDKIHAMAKDALFRDDGQPITLPPLLDPKPADIKTPAEIEAQFKVADGYAVNLFASEEQFPELQNPEQIAFDAQGRLWVVTMPSFPGTIPGDIPHGKVIILEDTDRDGKADKSTIFADQLTVPDGIAFYKDGIILSHQPRLLYMKDTDGDSKADYSEEILRGIDVTDAHHGGMINIGPLGHVIFCDGVFHRSQLETPHGVTRGIDATTYRLDLRSGHIGLEYQTLTPNPWKVTWDRWGNLFQMYGDGFVQDSHAMPWTPFGVYHPFGRGISIRYGKGSAAATISSPNFPDEYQQGMASAVLLRKCFVSISKHETPDAYFKGTARLDILSSPDQAFRPVDIAFGLDGGMYVSDFCSRIIGHAQNSMRDPRWDGKYGRVWRIVHTGKPVVNNWPKIEGASTDELLQLLHHPQDLVRFHARRILRHTEGIPQKIDQWLSKGQPDQATLEALWILHDQREARPEQLHKLLASEDPRIRAAAVNLLRFQHDLIKDTPKILQKMAKDTETRTKTQVIHTVSHLQQHNQAYAAILGHIDTANSRELPTILADASHGTFSGKSPEVPVLSIPRDSTLQHWLLKEKDGSESPYNFAKRPKGSPSLGTLRTILTTKEKQRAILSIRHSYVKVYHNGVPVVASANWWSKESNVQIELQPGPNEIRSEFIKGRSRGGFAPVHLFDPTGQALKDIEFGTEENLPQLAQAYDSAHHSGDNTLRITAVPNQLAFSPTELRVQAGKTYTLLFDNPDHQIHNLLISEPGTTEEIGQLADQMAQDPQAFAKHFVPDSQKILFSTPLLNAKDSITKTFTAPTKPGHYPYLCTFPGHWRVMKGILIVE